MRGRIRAGSVWSVVVLALLAGGLVALAQGPSGEALVWLAGGTPVDPVGPGTLAWVMAGEDTPDLLVNVPDEGLSTRFFPCGAEPFAASGEYFVAYVGGQRGDLYRVPLQERTIDSLVRWGDASALACNGVGRAVFSPNGQRWAYLDYPAGVVSLPYPAGEMRVLDADSGEAIASFADVVAFAWHEDGLYFVRFFANAQGRADEAAMFWWPGQGEALERATIIPTEECTWRVASLDAQPDTGEVALSFGELCTGGSRWRLYTATPQGVVSEHVYMAAGGAYFSDAYINQVYYLADGRILATYPNGRARNLANLVWVSPAANAITRIANEVIVDTYPGGSAMHVRRSADGSALAFVTVTANQDYAVHRLALTGDPTLLTFSAGRRDDLISTLFFTPGGDLAYVAGGADGADNALWLLPADASEPLLVRRGRYLRDVGLGAEGVALLLEHVPADTGYLSTAANLVAVTLEENGAQTVLVAGRDARAWASPLSWR
ncbi:MAG: hypothetical protein JW910_03150 [Anaerolineae bacterium]|nr:hypothetical protein [Anaerolineae bacterium]